MAKTRYAIVGAGHRSHMYLDAITGPHAAQAELVAICEPNPVRAQHAAARTEDRGAARPAIWKPAELEAMIRESSVDRVIVCSRDDTHAEMIIRSLDAGAD